MLRFPFTFAAVVIVCRHPTPRSVFAYSIFFPAAFALAHLALAAAESLALTAGLLRRSFFLLGLEAFAQRILRALARALITFLRWAAVM